MQLRTLALFPLLLALCGCAGYRVGPSNGQEAGARSIQVKPFLNHTLEAGMADELTSALRKAIQRDGTYQLATHGGADIVVTGVINTYQRRELSLSSSDSRTVQDYQVLLTTQVTATEAGTGKVLLDRPVSAGALLRVGDDFVSSERQAVPMLARDLARQITSLLADGDW
jgi:hypothetical protein